MTAPAAAILSETVRSFVDLRAFAADPDAGLPGSETGDEWLSSRRLLPLPEGAVTVAALRLDGGTGDVPGLASDEFVILLEGGLALTSNSGTTVLAPTNSLTIPAGVAFGWKAAPATVAIVMRCAGGAPGATSIVPVDIDAKRTPSNPPSLEVLLSDTPACRNFTDYASKTGEFKVGTWDSTAYQRKAIEYLHYELMHLIEGEVEFVDEVSGKIGVFRAGDVFMMVQGARCSWKHEGFCAKQYAIYRPL